MHFGKGALSKRNGSTKEVQKRERKLTLLQSMEEFLQYPNTALELQHE